MKKIILLMLVFCSLACLAANEDVRQLVGNSCETTAKLPEDKQIWPIPELETTKDIFSVGAEFVESKEILSVTQGNWRKVTYLVKYKVTQKDKR